MMGAIPPEWPGFIGEEREGQVFASRTQKLIMKLALFGMSPKERGNKRRMENKIAELLRFSAEIRDKLVAHEEVSQEILRQAMFDFGSHRQTCAVFDPEQKDAICDCGYDDLTAGLFEKYKEEEEVQIQDAEGTIIEGTIEEIPDSASPGGEGHHGRIRPTRPWPDPPERE
jgi:hypothetical protein